VVGGMIEPDVLLDLSRHGQRHGVLPVWAGASIGREHDAAQQRRRDDGRHGRAADGHLVVAGGMVLDERDAALALDDVRWHQSGGGVCSSSSALAGL
jgi:hypothetical protein